MTDQSHTQMTHRAIEHADWSKALAPKSSPRPQHRADWPEWARFVVFYVAVFVVLAGWVSAIRTLAEMLQ